MTRSPVLTPQFHVSSLKGGSIEKGGGLTPGAHALCMGGSFA
jgi:hypothetical protein